MEESITSALLAHISRLEGELASLRQTVSRYASSTGSDAPTSQPVSAELPEEIAAAAQHAAELKHASGLDLAKGQFLAEVFTAAQIEDEEVRSEALGNLTHTAAMLGPRSIEYLKAFNWKQLVKNTPTYLQNDAVDSFKVTRWEPTDSTASKVKIFLKPSDGRHPAPILLERDPAKGGVWRIAQISL